MDSREYDSRVAKPCLRILIGVLNRIASQDFGNEGEEVSLWAKVASLFMDKEFRQAIEDLVRREVVAKTISSVDNLYYDNHVRWAKYILDRVVIPYIEEHSR